MRRRPSQRAWLLGAVAASLALASACGTSQPARGGLMLIVASDGPLPIDKLQIEVSSGDKALLSNTYRVPQEAALPTTLAIVSNGHATAQAKIVVTGWQETASGDVPLDRRDAIVTQIPSDRLAALTVVLSARCSSKVTLVDGVAESSCGGGSTCDPASGACASAEVNAKELPNYQAGSEQNVSLGGQPPEPGGGSSGSGGAVSGSGGEPTTPPAAGAGGDGPAPDSCVGVTCDTPPAATCESASKLRAYDSVGSCQDGKCQYSSRTIACECVGDACTTDPCLAVTCDMPPAAGCKNETTRTIYAASGSCDNGSCSYEAGTEDCKGKTPKCKNLQAGSACVACLSDADCGGAKPVCDAATAVCVTRPSCTPLGAICGPGKNTDCCSSIAVPGGTCDRIDLNNKKYPATVSDFRLDTFEVTVGRFRNFVAAFSQNMTPAGAGANPHNAADTGWDTAWNTSLPANADALKTALKCNSTFQTWTDMPDTNESRPINCITWYEAEAFCIWDGGRLPTQAEWNHVARGAAAQCEQRYYPWSNPPSSSTISYEYASYLSGMCDIFCPTTGCTGDYFVSACNLQDIVEVGGKSPMGNGSLGHAELVGNIAEWSQDWYSGNGYPLPCTDCANLTPATYRITDGGGFRSETRGLMSAGIGVPGGRYPEQGVRCARAP